MVSFIKFRYFPYVFEDSLTQSVAWIAVESSFGKVYETRLCEVQLVSSLMGLCGKDMFSLISFSPSKW